MWNSGAGFGEQGAGFINSPNNQFSSPNASQGANKPVRRAKNLVPVMIQQILDAQDDSVKIGNTDVHLVKIIGTIKKVEKTATKITYTLDDNTGQVDMVKWLEEGDADEGSEDLREDLQCEAVGSVRNQMGTKLVMCYMIKPITDPLQVTAHSLEVTHAKLKAKAMEEKMNNPSAQPSNTGLANSMVGSGFDMMGGGGAGTVSYGGAMEGLNPSQQMVYSVVQQCMDEQGIHRNQVHSAMGGKLQRTVVDQVLEFLSSEGHIYSTIDDDHYKATDS